MKRLLCIVSAMNAGGAETFLMKMYRKLDTSRYQMDFCVNIQEKGLYDEEIKELGEEFFIFLQNHKAHEYLSKNCEK